MRIVDGYRVNCEACGLCCLEVVESDDPRKRSQAYRPNHNCMDGSGDLNAAILLVGDFPGSAEDNSGLPLEGKSGTELDVILAAAGMEREQLRVTHSVRCKPYLAEKPTTDEIKVCREHLIAEIKSMPNLQVIVALGNTAYYALTGNFDGKLPNKIPAGIMRKRGVAVYSKDFGCYIVPTLHPAAVVRSPFNRVLCVEDMVTAKTYATGLVPDKIPTTYHLCYTLQEFDQFIAGVKEAKCFAFDLETTSKDYFNRTERVLNMTASWKSGEAWYIPWYEADPAKQAAGILEAKYDLRNYWVRHYNKATADYVCRTLRGVFEDNSIAKGGHNVKFDARFLAGTMNIHVRNFGFDTLLEHFALDENTLHGLKELSARFTDLGYYDSDLDEAFKAVKQRVGQHNAKIKKLRGHLEKWPGIVAAAAESALSYDQVVATAEAAHARTVEELTTAHTLACVQAEVEHQGRGKVKYPKLKLPKLKLPKPPTAATFAASTIRWLTDTFGTADLDVLSKLPTKLLEAHYGMIDLETLRHYACMDADCTWRLHERFAPLIEAEELSRITYSLMVPTIPVVLEGEVDGMCVNEALVAEIAEEILAKRAELAKDIYHRIGREINIKSPQQLIPVLYGDKKDGGLGLPVLYTTKSGSPSTGKLACERLLERTGNVVLKKIIQYRHLSQLDSNFLTGFIPKLDPVTRRAHPTFKVNGTVTGRVTSNNPNLLNIPRDNYDDMEQLGLSSKATKLRNIFIPGPPTLEPWDQIGHVFVDADLCIAAGSMVSTQRGLVPIEEVTTDDWVVQEDKTLRKVIRVAATGSKPVVSLMTKHGYTLVATEDHRVRVIDANGDYVWRRVKELESEDYLALVSGTVRQDNVPYQVLPLTPRAHYKERTDIMLPTELTESLAEMLGYWVGDGTFDQAQHKFLRWVVTESDTDILSWLDCAFEAAFGVIPGGRSDASRGVYTRCVGSKRLIRWLEQIGCNKEHVPDVVARSRPSVIAAFLRGLFEADGSAGQGATGRITLASSRRSLMREVQDLLLHLGIISTLREGFSTSEHGSKRFPAYYVNVHSPFFADFEDVVGFMSARKRQRLTCLISTIMAKNGANGNIVTFPNLAGKVKALGLSGEDRRLLNNTSALGRPVTKVLATKLRDLYPDVYDALGLQRLVEYGQYFDKLLRVEQIGVRQTYDLSVEGTQTFVADGFVVHNCQAELRMFASMSHDARLMGLFAADIDIHSFFANIVFLDGELPEDELWKIKAEVDIVRRDGTRVSGAQLKGWRYQVKRLVFGTLYGQSAEGASKQFGFPLETSIRIIKTFFDLCPQGAQWIRATERFGIAHGYVVTPWGRRRRLPMLQLVHGRVDSVEDRQLAGLRQEALRQAVNSPIQAHASDYNLWAAGNIWGTLADDVLHGRFRVIVYDAIIIECAVEEALQTAAIMERCMTSPVRGLHVPMEADVEIVDCWSGDKVDVAKSLELHRIVRKGEIKEVENPATPDLELLTDNDDFIPTALAAA